MAQSKKNRLGTLAALSVFVFLVLPAISFAYTLGEPLVPACRPDATSGDCIWGWNELLLLVNNLNSFILKYMSVPIAAVMFAYAGFTLLVPGGESGSAVTKAKTIFLNTLLGFILALAAWLIVNLILTTLGWKGEWIGF